MSESLVVVGLLTSRHFMLRVLTTFVSIFPRKFRTAIHMHDPLVRTKNEEELAPNILSLVPISERELLEARKKASQR